MIADIFVINLEKDKNRLANLENNFKTYGVTFKRIDAVYGKDLSREEITNNTTLLCRTILCNKSIIGSGMSHIKTWQHIAEQPQGFYMICEDDINLTPDSIPNIGKILELFKDKDQEKLFISLNSCEAYHYHSTKSLIVKGTLICGISCYIITPSTAKALLDFIRREKLNQYIDIQTTMCNCGIQYYVSTFPIVRDSTYGGYKTSNNMGAMYSLPLIQFLVDVFLPEHWSSVINFRLNLVLICLLMTYCLSVGTLVLLGLFLLNVAWWRNGFVTNYVALECVLLIFFRLWK
jgi:GR25 family glycosyltransferase involved in LPS biosynthesis